MPREASLGDNEDPREHQHNQEPRSLPDDPEWRAFNNPPVGCCRHCRKYMLRPSFDPVYCVICYDILSRATQIMAGRGIRYARNKAEEAEAIQIYRRFTDWYGVPDQRGARVNHSLAQTDLNYARLIRR